VRLWRCRFAGELDGTYEYHYFRTRVGGPSSVRRLLDEAVPAPMCPQHDHVGWRVRPNGTYVTLDGPRQRYRCVDPADSANRHSFSAVLPRSAVDHDTCCDDCRVPTPKNAGVEAPTRRMNYPATVVYSVPHDLSEGRAYTHASMRALEQMGRPAGRSRHVRGRTPDELNDLGHVGPRREAKTHWHIAADILERFAPVVTEETFAAIQADEDENRAAGLPVVYVADEVPVRCDYARSARFSNSPVVWNPMVVSRMRWERGHTGALVGRSSKLVRVRALPNVTKDAWTLVLSELAAPDFLVADGAAAIENAARTVWAGHTTFVPCVYHATDNIRRRLNPTRAQLPEKVRDHLYQLTREAMAAGGAAAVADWFDELAQLATAADMPLEPVAALRVQYEPLLARSAAVAQQHANPRVPISNASVESQVDAWVKKLTRRRGAMFANLARTNLLGDLIVAGANGALLRRHEVVQKLRDSSRQTGGWAPPPRALVEPAGTFALRDASSVVELLHQEAVW
jgi:hypothetical protein